MLVNVLAYFFSVFLLNISQLEFEIRFLDCSIFKIFGGLFADLVFSIDSEFTYIEFFNISQLELEIALWFQNVNSEFTVLSISLKFVFLNLLKIRFLTFIM